MNKQLTEQIVRHIFSNFAVIQSEFINLDKSKSLMSKEFKLPETLTFSTENNEIINNVWGCQMSAGEQEIKILLGDCTQDKELKEYCLIVQLKNSHIYGVYLLLDDSNNSIISVSLDGKKWMQCNTYLQANFLSGMESIKDTGYTWNKCSNYKSQYNYMLSFINYYNLLYEVNNER